MEQEHKVKSANNELTLDNEPFLEVSCPFLGVADDPGTPMGFAAPSNQCYAVKPVLNVTLERQKTYCLSDCYTDCQLFQQKMAAASEEDGAVSRFLRRVVTGRTLAEAMMLVLILLAVLTWWPPPGTSRDEGTVFGGSSTSLNSPNAGNDGENSAEQPSVSQEVSEEKDPSPAAASNETLEETQAVAPAAASRERSGKSKELDTDQTSDQGAALSPSSFNDETSVVDETASSDEASSIDEASAVEDVENLLQEPSSPPEVQKEVLPEPEEIVEEEPVPEKTGSDRPGQGRVDQSSVVEVEGRSSENNIFSPIAYGEKQSDDEMLNIYQEPGSGNYVRIARPELFNLIGRDETGSWVKISTESGIEGWVRVSDTGLGSWITKLPQIGP